MPEAQDLVGLLRRIAFAIEQNPASPATQSISVHAGPGQAAKVVGTQISVTAQAGPGPAVGSQITVTSGTSSDSELALIRELHEAAETAASGQVPKTWVRGLLDRVGQLNNRAVDGATIAACKAINEERVS